ncbi:hypothetical protein, partial [uncultured Sphingomonas sp.]|uniref:hypothetical protein n=1 Tax=uncultured Sphingomonas sp. TaxID=158754 RepID=UPI0025E98C37
MGTQIVGKFLFGSFELALTKSGRADNSLFWWLSACPLSGAHRGEQTFVWLAGQSPHASVDRGLWAGRCQAPAKQKWFTVHMAGEGPGRNAAIRINAKEAGPA